MELTETPGLDTELKQLITTSQAWYFNVIPAEIEKGVLKFFFPENKDPNGTAAEMEVLLGREVELVKVPESWFMDWEMVRSLPVILILLSGNTNGEKEKRAVFLSSAGICWKTFRRGALRKE